MPLKISRIFFLLIALFAISTIQLVAQEQPKSPPATASHSIGDLNIAIDYHAPSARGRAIWGSLVPYNKIWRTGANNATVFKVSQDVLVNGQPLAAGKYALFTIPGEEECTIIFNKDYQQWGAYNYDQSKDALRIKTAFGAAPEFTEQMTFMIADNDENVGVVSLVWENGKINFNVQAQ